MLGAIIGDYIGSQMEFKSERLLYREDFELITDSCRFTDDTVMTVATADAILNKKEFTVCYKEWGSKYPRAGYGAMFGNWLNSDKSEPFGSYGNGSAMRVSPVSWLYGSYDEMIHKAVDSAAVTHNHFEGIKGAQVVAFCIYWINAGMKKEEIKSVIEEIFDYNLSLSLEEIRASYTEEITAEMFSCQKSIPEAIICFLQGSSFEDVVRKAVSLGGDTDTQAAIAGSIAEGYYGIPEDLKSAVMTKLPADMRIVVEQFQNKII